MCYIRGMNKKDAIKLLSGGNIKAAAKILGVARETLYKWPNELTQPQTDQVNGAIARVEEERQSINRKYKGGK